MMRAPRTGFFAEPQPGIAIAVALVAVAALCWSGTMLFNPPSILPWTSWLGWGLALAAAVVVATLYPIHIDTHMKLSLASIPLFMLILLFPPFIAGGFAGFGVATAQLIVLRRRGLWWSDVVTVVARNTLIVVVAAAFVTDLTAWRLPFNLMLLLTIPWVFCLDVLTSPLYLYPMTRRHPLRQIPDIARATWQAELVQYLIGALGVILIRFNPWAVILLLLPIYLVYSSFRRAFEFQDVARTLLHNMADLVDNRDPLTAQHSQRVAEMSAKICQELRIGCAETDLIVAAARVHDVGKIVVPDAILYKPGPLNDQEWVVMKSHVETGAHMLQSSLRSGQQARRLTQIVRSHHERWDGQGYPHALAGPDIVLGGRIIAVADAFDVMTTDRPYHSRMNEHQALVVLSQGRNTQWDAVVVDALLRIRGYQLPQPTPTTPRSAPLGQQFRAS
ncbi:MAG: HD domain-containing protein [Herpetosiphonaceae bacterium]|nr:HD domain-containing protein [Herpetosiphonaceae bacterium]